MKIPIAKPFFGPEEKAAVQIPLDTGWVVQGPYVQEFERRFSAYTGAPASVATSSCTTALHIAVAALGLAPGDEVIVPAFTWVATPNVVEYMGATPVFVDIDPVTFNMDPKALDAARTERTVGIIPVHLFGLSADMDPIMAFAKQHGLWVVEDAACSFGGWYKGTHTGTIGDAGCFSFHPRKSITTGEGGMITTGRDDLATRSRSLRDHGANLSDFARHTKKGGYLLPDYDLLGYNFRMTDIQAAIGVVQMDRADWILGQRRRRAAAYDDALRPFDWLAAPQVPDDMVHGYQAYVCRFRPEAASLENVAALNAERNQLMTLLEEQGIATRPGTHAPVRQGYYRKKYGFTDADFPNATIAELTTFALPLYPQMTDPEQEKVVAALRDTKWTNDS